MQMFDPKTARIYSDVVKESNAPNIPFFHEGFLFRLFKNLDPIYAEKFWRETNSIYLLSGLPDLKDVISYYNPKFESPNYRFIGKRFDRQLYSPDALLALTSLFLSGEMVHKLLNTEHLEIFGELRDERYGGLFREFRESYFAMVCEISKAIWLLETFPDQRKVDVQALFASYLSGDLEGLGEFGVDLTSDLAKLSGTALGGGAALIGPIIDAARKHGSSVIRKLTWRARHPQITRFFHSLSRRLKKT